MSRRSFLIFSCLIFVALLLQSALLPVFLATPFKPDLLLIVVVFMALRGSYELGTPAAWLLGMTKDMFSGLYLGLNAFAFLVIFLIIKSVSDRLYAESSFLFVVAVVGATLACVSMNLILLVFTNSPGITYTIGLNLFPHLLVNAFAASLLALIPGFADDEEVA
jgi:rod shape-determining protein MreD